MSRLWGLSNSIQAFTPFTHWGLVPLHMEDCAGPFSRSSRSRNKVRHLPPPPGFLGAKSYEQIPAFPKEPGPH